MIYFFTKGHDNVPSSRRRVFYLADYLKKHFDLDFTINVPVHRPWWELSFRRLRELAANFKLLAKIKPADVLYLHRPIYQADFILLVLLFRIFGGQKYIFDFDDPIFLHSPVKTWLLTKLASQVVVGGHFLYDYAVKINKNTQIIPMLLDAKADQPIKDFSRPPEVINIGWVGDAKNHLANLKIIAPVLKLLLEKKFAFTFTLIGARGHAGVHKLFNLPGLDAKIIDWLKPEEVGPEILKFDIALTPLLDTPWVRGKCPLKTYEYMQAGIPVVASNVGEEKFSITNGVNGILVENDTGLWAEAILKLAHDFELRKNISQLARQTIAEHYSYHSRVAEYLELFKALPGN